MTLYRIIYRDAYLDQKSVLFEGTFFEAEKFGRESFKTRFVSLEPVLDEPEPTTKETGNPYAHYSIFDDGEEYDYD